MVTLSVDLCWIPAEFGGHTHPPVQGLRPTIRFQRNVAAWITLAWDVQMIRWEPTDSTWRGLAELAFSKDANPDREYLQPGELIELLSAYRVIAVGKVREVLK